MASSYLMSPRGRNKMECELRVQHGYHNAHTAVLGSAHLFKAGRSLVWALTVALLEPITPATLHHGEPQSHFCVFLGLSMSLLYLTCKRSNLYPTYISTSATCHGHWTSRYLRFPILCYNYPCLSHRLSVGLGYGKRKLF